MNKLPLLAAAAFTAVALLADGGAAQAASYSFSHLHSGGETTPSDQLSMEVIDNGDDTVSFTFYNSSEIASIESASSLETIAAETAVVSDGLSIEAAGQTSDAEALSFYSKDGTQSSVTGIYLAGTDGLLVLPGKITEQSEGVSFSTGANPSNLPGGTAVDFQATVGADSNPPVKPSGINASKEYVTWTFALESGVTYKDVVSALDSGEMRVGLLVPGASGGSSSFLNNYGGSAAVPLPASVWLMFGALGGIGYISRRGRRGGNAAVREIASPG